MTFWLGPEGDPEQCGMAEKAAEAYMQVRAANGKIQYFIRPYDHRIREAYRALLPHQESVNRQGKLNWKFLTSPPGCIATAEANGEIVGMIGALSLQVTVEGKKVQYLQAIDTIVSSTARGKGCFVRMGRELHQTGEKLGFAGIFGFPNANAAKGWFGHLGWQRAGHAPFLIKPLRAGFFLRRFLPSIDFPLTPGRGKNVHVRVIDRFDDQVEDVWRNFSRGKLNGVVRSADYLNLRLIDCPCAGYRNLGFFQGDRLKSVVSTLTIEKHGGRIGYVMDAFGDESLQTTLTDALARLVEDGAEVVLGWCFQTSPNRKNYRKSGFIPLPRAFAPNIEFGYCPFDKQQLTHPWYISYLDSDSV